MTDLVRARPVCFAVLTIFNAERMFSDWDLATSDLELVVTLQRTEEGLEAIESELVSLF